MRREGGYTVEKGEKQKYAGEVTGRLVRLYRDTHAQCARTFSFSPRTKGASLRALMTLCQMEAHSEPGTVGLSRRYSLISRLFLSLSRFFFVLLFHGHGGCKKKHRSFFCKSSLELS